MLLRLGGGFRGSVTGLASAGSLVMLTIQLFEEFAWTGFLQRRLQDRHGALAASLLIAPAFGLSHLMLNYLESGEVVSAAMMVGVQIIFALFFRVMITTLANLAGGSALIAAVSHAAFNTANGEFAVALIGGNEARWLPLALVAVFGIVSVVVTRGRLDFGEVRPKGETLALRSA